MLLLSPPHAYDCAISLWNGKIVRAAESDITLGANEVITDKTVRNTIAYSYDADDKLIKKRIIPANGTV